MSLHVLPVDDGIDHSRTEDCVRGPSLEPRPDGRAGWAVAHNGLDAQYAEVLDLINEAEREWTRAHRADA